MSKLLTRFDCWVWEWINKPVYTREKVALYLYYVLKKFTHLTDDAACKYCKQVIGKLKDNVAACKHFHH